ncbi:MAG: hypothetical protein ACJ71W_09065 [Terriglobales bacterium]
MRKKLDRAKALEAYVVLRIRMRELRAFLLIARFEQVQLKGFENRIFKGNNYLSSAIFGWAYSLIDGHNSAANLFDVWRVLFPSVESEIGAFCRAHGNAINQLKQFRDNTAFHGNKSLERYVKALVNLMELQGEMAAFFPAFEQLQQRFLAFDESISAELQIATSEVANRLNLDANRIRDWMLWPE